MSYDATLELIDTNLDDHRSWDNTPPSNTKTKSNEDNKLLQWPKYNIQGQEQSLDISQRFDALVKQWNQETIDLSSLTEILSHKSYLAIIALGRPALPLLFREIEERPNFWFTALEAILRASGEYAEFIDEANFGDLQSITDEWISWGKRHGYID